MIADEDATDSAEVVQAAGKVLHEMLCDHQTYFLIVLDDHAGTMPTVEDVMKRPQAERARMAQVLRMWAQRFERGTTGHGEG